MLPTLSTDQFVISPLQKGDIPLLRKMYLEPDSNKYVTPLRNKSASEFEEFFSRKLKLNEESDAFGMWTIKSKEDNEFIGTCNLNALHGTNWIQMGCHLMKRQWNRGIASEVCKEICRYGLEDLELPFIYGIFEPENEASRKLCKNLGFHFDRKEDFMNEEIELHKCTKNSLIRLR